MMKETMPVAAVADMEDVSPFVIEFFMLQGIGFRCMGYRDKDGKWRSAFNHVELFGKIQIVG